MQAPHRNIRSLRTGFEPELPTWRCLEEKSSDGTSTGNEASSVVGVGSAGEESWADAGAGWLDGSAEVNC